MTAANSGQPITKEGDRLVVPDQPIIPFIEGDGIGPDIWRASQRVFDAAVEKAYDGNASNRVERSPGGREGIQFRRELATGRDTLDAFRTLLVGIKGPLTTPVGWRNPLIERCPSPNSGSLRLSPACPVLHRRSVSRERTGEDRHGHLP